MVKETQTCRGLQKAQGIANPLGKRLYTLKEAAQYLGRSVYSVRELIWSHELPVVKNNNGRKLFVDIIDLDEYVTKNKSLYV